MGAGQKVVPGRSPRRSGTGHGRGGAGADRAALTVATVLSASDRRALVDLARVLPKALRRLDDRDARLELDGRRPAPTVTVTATPARRQRPVPRGVCKPGEPWAAAELEALLAHRLRGAA